jgi:p-aminobenzoyl-glutamate transporter AbgT
MFLKVLDGALFLWTLWVFLLGFPNKKSATLNTSFHMNFIIQYNFNDRSMEKINSITWFING